MPPPTAAPPAATTSGQALQNLQGYQSQMQSPDQMVQNAQQSVGVGAAQQQVSGLRQAITNTTNLLNNVAPSVMGRTENSLVTSAQANKQIQNEQAPISQQLNKQSADYTNASDDLKTLTAQADQIAQLKEQGQTQQLGALKDIYDSLSAKEKQQFDEQNAQASQALEQSKLNEQIRANQAGESIANQKSQTLSPSEQKAMYDLQNQTNTQQGISQMNQLIHQGMKDPATGSFVKLGGDKFLSPRSYNFYKQLWGGQGLDPSKFDSYFSSYVNPTIKAQYPIGSTSLGGNPAANSS